MYVYIYLYQSLELINMLVFKQTLKSQDFVLVTKVHVRNSDRNFHGWP